MSHHDVVVVGGGLAGLTAAVRLAESGARVLVLAKGVGATHLTGGTVDVLGYALDQRVERPVDALPAFLGERPDHPYAHVGADGLRAAVAWFKDRVANGSLPGYAYVGDAEENLLLPSAVGVPRPSAVVPETMAGGDLRDGGPVLVAGFRAMKDFHPALLADTLTRVGVEARAVELELSPERRADVNALGFARGARRRGVPRRADRAARRPRPAQPRARGAARRAGDRRPARGLERPGALARAAACSRCRRSRRRCPGCACSRSCARRCGARAARSC